MKNKNRNRFTDTGEVAVKENSIPFLMKIAVSFSNVMSIIGLFFTILGGFFLIIFLSVTSLNSFDIPDDSPVAEGEITEILTTNISINEKNVLEYHYDFSDVSGGTYSGISYSSTSNKKKGDVVSVKYNSEIPENSVIVGMSSNEFPKWILLFVGVFPLSGVLMLYFGIKKGIRNVTIINFGKVAFGTFNRKQRTNASVNKQPVYKFYFDFNAPDGNKYTATGETHKTYLLQDEYKEPVIYNSLNPNEAVLVDTLPKSVRRFFKAEIDKNMNKI